MTMTDDELRQAAAAHAQPVLPGGECPPPEQLWALAAGELEAREAREVLDHISRCPACGEDFRVTRQLVAESLSTHAAAARPAQAPRRAGRGWFRGLAVAAVLALVAVGLGWRLSREPEIPMRQGGTEIVRSLLADGAPLPRHGARLRWSGPAAARYDVVVTTEDLEVVADVRGLEIAELVLPEASLTDLVDGTVLFWQVEAILADGRRVPSQSFRNRLVDE